MENKVETLDRVTAPELDKILGESFKVLDDGFIRVVDYMGSDESIVQAARVSYGRGTKSRGDDRGLLRYLIRNRHTSPFEMCEIKLHVRVPMDCWRQWIRHRTANVNEYSTRYSIAIDSAQKTKPDEWRTQGFVNRQGSEGTLDIKTGEELTKSELELQDMCRKVYLDRLDKGIAREQARKDLPLSSYTEAYWKIDLNNLLHFVELRTERKAQYEIRTYANTIGNEIIKRWCPVAWEAFQDYRIDSVVLSKKEQDILVAIIKGDRETSLAVAEKTGFITKEEKGFKRNMECLEFEEKLRIMNHVIPWI